jgi:hypothetical protein
VRVRLWAGVQLVTLGCGAPRPTLATLVLRADPVGIETSLFLIGDAGNPARRGEPVLRALRHDLDTRAGLRVVMFLGDNAYPSGLPDSTAATRAEAERRLAAQIDAVRGRGRVLFVPGNHDWRGPDGWAAVRRQTSFIARYGGSDSAMLPGDGCPGPVAVDVGARLRLVALDTHWWLHAGPRPLDPASACPADSPAEVTAALREAIVGAGDRHVVVAGHHPLATGGAHGGYFSWTDHVFPLRAWKRWLVIPLPLIGSVYPLARRAGISRQDVSNALNRAMRDSLTAALTARPPLAYAAGHEHNLQVLDGRPATTRLLVSGSGFYGHAGRAVGIAGTRFAARSAGYMRLDLVRDGRVRLAVLAVAADGTTREAYSEWLGGEPTP